MCREEGCGKGAVLQADPRMRDGGFTRHLTNLLIYIILHIVSYHCNSSSLLARLKWIDSVKFIKILYIFVNFFTLLISRVGTNTVKITKIFCIFSICFI